MAAASAPAVVGLTALLANALLFLTVANQSCSVLCFLYIASFPRRAKLQHNGAELAAGSVESLQGITDHEWLNCIIFFARNQWQLFDMSKSFHAQDRARRDVFVKSVDCNPS